MTPTLCLRPVQQLPRRVQIPSSKSLSHRALILGHHAGSTELLEGLLVSNDLAATQGGLEALAHGEVIDCGNSGTTLRLLLGQAALLEREFHFIGDESLQQRPSGPLLEALATAGVQVDSVDGHLPIRIRGPLRSGSFRLNAELSSQFLSSLLLALPFAEGDSEIAIIGKIASAPYVQLSLDLLKQFGLRVEVSTEGFFIPGGQRAQINRYQVESDWSAAGLAAALAICRQQALRLGGLNAQSSQGDRALLGFLEAFGTGYHWSDGDLVLSPGPLLEVKRLDLRDCPDLFPPMAVLSALAPGETQLVGSRGLRHKESDRIAVMARALTRCGIQVIEEDTGLRVSGGQPRSATLSCQADHRIHMSLAALAQMVPGGLVIDHPGSVAVSWPDFHRDLGLHGSSNPHEALDQ